MPNKYINIGIATYSTVQLTTVYGLTEMLNVANSYIKKQITEGCPLFRVSHWSINENNQFINQYSTSPQAPEQQNVIVIPGTIDTDTVDNSSELIIEWISEQYASGAIATSVCGGSFMLAKSGILKDRCVTTHWILKDRFEKEYPSICLDIDKILIDEGDIITAGGVTAWIELGLQLIRRFAGTDIMSRVAKYLLVDPNGKSQQFYRVFTPSFEHGNKSIIAVQHWIHTHYAQEVHLKELASIGNMSQRTLIRHFKSSLGLSPTCYIQKIRIDKAREMLESSTASITEISHKVAYNDPASFRKVFIREIGLTPGSYRARFNIESQ